MKLRAILLIYTVLFTNCELQASPATTVQKSTIIITGKLRPNTWLTCYRFNDYLTGFIHYNKACDSLGRFRIEIPTQTADIYLIQQKGVYIEPGDSVYVTTDENGEEYFSGNNPYQENFFNEFQKKFGLITFYLNKDDSYKDVMKFKQWIDQTLDNSLAFLRQYSQQHHLSPGFSDYAADNIKYRYLASYYAAFFNDSSIRQSGGYVSRIPVNTGVFPKSGYLRSRIYTLALNYYNSYLAHTNVKTEKLQRLISEYENADTAFTGSDRAYVQFNILSLHYKSGYTNFDSYLSKFRSTFTNSPYVHEIDSVYNVYYRDINLFQNNDLLASELKDISGNTITFGELLKRNKNKVLYLDFWASWCAPCLAEMPASKKLLEELKREAVTFIYISTETSEVKWKKAMEQHNLGTSNQYLIVSSDKKGLNDYFKISSIPRYILIDQPNNILMGDAPRPSSQEIRKILLKK